ncbi:bZIP transcription factor 11-like [Zingiber officinale]|uniref:bZIP transcription factor 11-like n=1 Tax=Zingiber officinale TaxID=94328 RepID=UPI001C4DAAEA|nr:bZIP transcription factor 11-like [Zingiber officinale]
MTVTWMGCGSATSSGSTSRKLTPGSTSEEEEHRALIAQRKLRRMLSNRESARRSRLRKQKHMQDLTAQVGRLRKENGQILVALDATAQLYAGVEAENTVLRAQAEELSARLKSLNEIAYCYLVEMEGGSSMVANEVGIHGGCYCPAIL